MGTIPEANLIDFLLFMIRFTYFCRNICVSSFVLLIFQLLGEIL